MAGVMPKPTSVARLRSMTVTPHVAQKFQEEYCLRFVRCSLDDSNSAIFRVQFDSCLKDEALDKYEAIPADTD
jgi:hypothetical protein